MLRVTSVTPSALSWSQGESLKVNEVNGSQSGFNHWLEVSMIDLIDYDWLEVSMIDLIDYDWLEVSMIDLIDYDWLEVSMMWLTCLRNKIVEWLEIITWLSLLINLIDYQNTINI